MLRRHLLALSTVFVLACALSACAQSSGVTPASAAAVPGPSSSTARGVPPRRATRRGPRRRQGAPAAKDSSSHPRAAKLVVSRASPRVIQGQPAPGSCRARGHGPYSAPDPSCTPGALNPNVTQATIDRTICVPGWTKTVRPPESVTEPEKLASMAAYGDGGSAHAYEYDHLVSLELGGALNDARNLWPEPGASPNPKDSVENALHRLVCRAQMRLARAQHIIATGWIAWAKHHSARAPTSTPTPPTPSPATGSGPNKPISEVNCSDFPTHAAAQRWFQQHGGSPSDDVAGLDANHNGIACESLP